jgi:soluble lytic murein transglycosylase
LQGDVLQVLFPIPYRREIDAFSKLHGVDPFLVTAIMKQESKFKRLARSRSFARGLMQLIPPTAIRLAAGQGISDFSVEQLYDPEINITLGVRYIREISEEFGKESEMIAAAYNGGEANVRRWLAGSKKGDGLDFFSNIDFAETKNYVALVTFNHEMYKRIYGTAKAPSR